MTTPDPGPARSLAGGLVLATYHPGDRCGGCGQMHGAGWRWHCSCGRQRGGYGEDERRCRDGGLAHQIGEQPYESREAALARLLHHDVDA